MHRVYAHRIIIDSEAYTYTVAELTDDGQIKLLPYDKEIYGTEFYNGTVQLSISSDGRRFKVSSQPYVQESAHTDKEP